MRHLLWIGAALLAAACNDTPPHGAGASQATSSPVTADQASTSARAAAAPRYVGRWAAAKTACGHEAWAFEERSLSTAGEVGCSFNDVSEALGGYDIKVSCQAEGQGADGELRLRLKDATEGMTVEGGPYGWKADLIYCGR